MSTQYKIEFADEQDRIVDVETLQSAVAMVLSDHGLERYEISIALVDDPTIRVHNKTYLSHDYETDVISFVLDYDEDLAFLVGQLIVSTDTAATMAEKVGCSMDDELLLYVIHGMLHLVGYDDVEVSDAADMRSAEKKYLNEFGIEHRWVDGETDSDEKGVSS